MNPFPVRTFRRCLFAAALGLGLLASAKAQEVPRRFRLVSYNVENLFDTLHTAGHADADFLPDGSYGWRTVRYRHKLSLVARTIAACGEAAPPDLVALCEVEGDSVLTDLCRRSLLARLGYDYLVTHGDDRRGLNVALLYQPLSFRPLTVASLTVPPQRGDRPTRNVLHVCGLLPTRDTLDVFVCHLPSRAQGSRQTDRYRLRVAQRVRTACDSIFQRRSNAFVVVAGDFNDESADASLRKGLRVQRAGGACDPATLYDLTLTAQHTKGIVGTYKFRHRWQMLDHVVVSGALLRPDAALRTTADACRIAAFDFLLEKDGEWGWKPRRTFLGKAYHGGVSDHLPLVVDLFF